MTQELGPGHWGLDSALPESTLSVVRYPAWYHGTKYSLTAESLLSASSSYMDLKMNCVPTPIYLSVTIVY